MSCEVIRSQILEQNILVHRMEAKVYEVIHPQIFNWHHRCKSRRDFRFIKSLFPKDKNVIRVLDLGCGTGFLTTQVLLWPSVEITGVDLSPEMLDQLKAKLTSESRTRTSLIAGEVLDFLKINTKRYDLIMTSALLHHLYDFDEFIALALTRLNDGGILYIAYEPLKQSVTGRFRFLLHRGVRSLDMLIFALRMKFSGMKIHREHENSLADYQTTLGGIDPAAILKVLSGEGEVLKLEKFATRASGFLAFISDRIIRSQNTFSVIFRKKPR